MYSAGHVEVTKYGFVECENLNTFGRFSFNKFNKEVEVDHTQNMGFVIKINLILQRLSALHAKGKGSEHHESDEDEGTIPALEMARRYPIAFPYQTI